MDQHELGRGSLLEGLEVPVVAPRIPLRERMNRAVDARIDRARAWVLAVPGRAERVQKAGAVALAALLVSAGTGTWLIVRPTPTPSYAHDPFEDVLNYTLLDDAFNRLSIEERLGLIKELVQRFQSMDGSESEVVAAFAAGISGNARKQLEKNASKLVLDVLDRGAIQYEKVPPNERAKAIETTFVDLYKTMDALDGRETKKSDAEIVKEGKEEAQRGKEWIRSRDREKLGRDTGRMAMTVNDTVAKQASAQQRGRMGLMMRDMSRHMRGEPVE